MSAALKYWRGMEPAARGLFQLQNDYGWHKLEALADMVNKSSQRPLNARIEKFESVDATRHLIAGSILQLAYFAIKRHGVATGKSERALHFEAEMNGLIREFPPARVKNFELPEEFCVGRDIGHLPLGVVVYAGRNQYNHFDDSRLGVINEVVFNHLEQLFPDLVNGHSFKLRGAGRPLSYSVVAALGWVSTEGESGFDCFRRDIREVLRIED